MSLDRKTKTERGVGAGTTMSLLQLTALLVRHSKLVVGLPLALASIVGVLSLLSDRTYTSSATFAPQAVSGGGNQLSGLAAQFGVRLRSGDENESPAFYAALLSSRAILREAVSSYYLFRENGDSLSLPAYFEIGAQAPSVRQYEAIRRLRQAVSTATDPETGVVRYAVTLEDPGMAQAVADRLLEALNQFNLERRQTQARMERMFVEARLKQLEHELVRAERQLAEFLRQNRSWEGSPELSNEHRRLYEETQLKRTLVSSLSEAYEHARIDEVRNTPVITVIESPLYPIRPNGRGTVGRVILTLFVGGFFAVVLAFVSDYLRGARHTEPSAYREIAEFRRRVRSRLPGSRSR